jgi:predicted DsbA family dithiol-disulfide isomerase
VYAEAMRVHIDVWSDYVCPFCYLHEPVLERLAEDFGDRVEIQWRAFELRPEPVPTLDPKGAYLLKVWTRAVYPMAQEREMTLRLPPLQPRSRLAHEAAHFAAAQGNFAAMNTALFQAFFEQGRDLGDRMVLIDLAKRVGLDPAALQRALSDGSYRKAVLSDEALALKLGVSGVPYMLVRREGDSFEQGKEISGAQPWEDVRATVDRVSAQ